MALSHSPKIVTDGLILCLDAADKKSYSGSGTTWTDRSGTGNNATLTNGPTFNSDGYFELDGSYTQKISCQAYKSLTGTENGSIYFWCNPSTPSTSGGHFLAYQGTGLGRIWIFTATNGSLTLNTYFGSGKDFYLTASGTDMLNKWGLVTVTFDRSGYQKIYYNAEFRTSRDISTASAISWQDSAITLGGFSSGPSWYTAEDKVSNLLVYNVEHTAEQITQNFNAQKGRFNL